ncbi:MAG TPA: hypothetical protein VF450_18235 [Noviherbaspirillum sp.]
MQNFISGLMQALAQCREDQPVVIDDEDAAPRGFVLCIHGSLSMETTTLAIPQKSSERCVRRATAHVRNALRL